MMRRPFQTSVFVVALSALAGASPAHHRAVVSNGHRVAEDPTQNCECRAYGRAFTIDEQICLNGRMMSCAMDQNVTSWRSTGRICPQS
jgi:hypothetical protein